MAADYLSLADYMRVRAIERGQVHQMRPHVLTMCRALELCVAGALPEGRPNLLINIPPRFGKTETVRAAIEWSLGHLPDSSFILSSYGLDLARASAYAVRDRIKEPWYQTMFPATRIAGGDRMDYFLTSAGGQVKAAGVGGPILGFGAGQKRDGFAGFFAIDDPIKTDEARRSEVIRTRNVEWYSGTAKNRLNHSATPFVLIMQRTHPDDLSGWILKNEKDLWHHVMIPGIDEETGKATWEETASFDYLTRLKTVDPFAYHALYQQRPVMPGGTIIQETWFNFYASPAEILSRCSILIMTADTAMKEGDANDWSVLQCWGIEGSDRIYLLDQIRGKWQYPDLVAAAKSFWAKWGRNSQVGEKLRSMIIEDKVSGTSLIQTLRHETEIHVTPWAPKHVGIKSEDKVSRVKAASWDIHGGSVWLPDPEQNLWVQGFIDECCSFTEDMGHSHDDQVDALAIAVLTWAASK